MSLSSRRGPGIPKWPLALCLTSLGSSLGVCGEVYDGGLTTGIGFGTKGKTYYGACTVNKRMKLLRIQPNASPTKPLLGILNPDNYAYTEL